MTPSTAQAYRAILSSEEINGQIESVSPAFRTFAYHLLTLPLGQRLPTFEAAMTLRPDGKEVLKAVFEATGDDAGEDEPVRFATIGDIRRGLDETRWVWDGCETKSIIATDLEGHKLR